jgi:hypothetical protein
VKWLKAPLHRSVDWESNYKCKASGWVATTKRAEDFTGTIPVSQTGNVTYSNHKYFYRFSNLPAQSIPATDETECVDSDYLFVLNKKIN